jgi:hypothetical protein
VNTDTRRQYRLVITLDGRQVDSWAPKSSWEHLLDDVSSFYKLRGSKPGIKEGCEAFAETRLISAWERVG